jgi:hypothetical protein
MILNLNKKTNFSWRRISREVLLSIFHLCFCKINVFVSSCYIGLYCLFLNLFVFNKTKFLGLWYSVN